MSDERKVTVASLFSEDLIQRRMSSLTEQRLLMAAAFPRPRLTRRQRIRNRIGARIDIARESLALRLAPWLDRP